MTREEAIKQVRVALERLKSNFSKTAWWTGTGEAFETLIPELKPDDETTRNEILAYIGSKTDIDLETHNRWCSYLEKQKYDRMKPVYDARESFESALEKAWNDYHNGYENVDKLEDDYVECAHAKGFREGYLFGIEKQKEQIPHTDFVVKPHKGDDANPYDMRVSEAQEYAVKRGFNIPFNDGEVYVDERHMTQTIGNVLRWADEHPKEQKPTAEKTRKPKFGVGEKIRYCGTEYEITGIEVVSDGYMYNVLDISPNPDNNSLYGLHSSREPRMEKIAEQKPEVKTGDDETEAQKEGDDRSFILDLLEDQLRYCKKNREGARRSRRIHSAMDWIKSVDGKCDIEEDRKETEFDPQPGERFWVRCKTDKSENYWFDKGEERPAYAAPGKGAYRVCFDKDGDKDSPGIWYLDKEWLFHDFDIVDEVNDKPVEQWPNLSNCKHDCRTCFARCFYRKEQNPELWKRITGNEVD